MKTEIIRQNEITVISLDGRLDTTSAKDFEDAIQPLLTTEGIQIQIDCNKLTYISSSGLRGFMLLLKGVTKNQGSLVVKNMCPEIKEIFNMTGFSSIFTIID